MKILIIVDDYLPGSRKIAGKMMHELASQFIQDGHVVSVITPGDKKDDQFNKIKDLKIHRFNAGKIKNTSKVIRALNESILSFRIYISLFRHLKNDKHELIVYYSPTIFFGIIVKILKKRWKSSTYLILRDFFPQWVIDQKMIKENSLIAKYFRFFEKINYNAADIIALQSPNNFKWFSQYFKTTKKLSVLYNWTNSDKYHKFPNRQYRTKLNLEDKVVFFYGGNIGKAQDMMNLVRLAENLREYKEAHFIFVGKGEEVDLIKNYIFKHKVKNIQYLGSVDQDEYKLMLSEFDIGLFSLHKDHNTHNFPGKLLGYMLFKMPILGSINPGNDLKEVVEKKEAGLISINGDDEKLLNNAIKLLEDSVYREKIGENAANLLREKFSVENASKQIINEIRQIQK